MEHNVTSRLRDIARHRAEDPAIVMGQAEDCLPEGRVVSYGELDRIVDAIAARTRGWGFVPGDRVNLLLRAHFPLLALKLGLARAGMVSCGIDVPGAAARIVGTGHRHDHTEPTLVVDPAWWTDVDAAPASIHAGGDALFMLQGTSGSTGKAKAVPVTHAKMRARARITSGVPLRRDACLLCTSGPGGGYGLRHALRVLDAGGRIVLADSSSDIEAIVLRHQVNLLVCSPHVATRTLEVRAPGAQPLAPLERIDLGGSRLSSDLVRAVAGRLCANVICNYGSTEAGPTASGPAGAMRGIEGASGFLLPGAELDVIDDRGRPLPRGTRGRLRVRTPGIADGYHADPVATSRAFRDGWFHPGDLGYVTPDGILVVTGRVDDLINLGGSKLSPEEVEAVMLRVPRVREAAAFGMPDALGKEVLHAAIVADGDLDVSAIEAVFRAHPFVPAPAVVLRLPSLPRNENGKLERRALAAFAKSSLPRRPAT